MEKNGVRIAWWLNDMEIELLAGIEKSPTPSPATKRVVTLNFGPKAHQPLAEVQRLI